MTTIMLPPINIGTAVLPSTAGLRLVADKDIRARDLEVARVVLDGAAKLADRYHTGDWQSDDDTGSEVASWLAAQFRALEVRHE